ncbi:MAG: FmdB family zinc ribbon protein [Janthinobacterium lividum]
MPTYEYDCGACGSFDARRAIAERDAAINCPECGAIAARVLLHAPQLTALSGAARLAHATNEQASHAPKRSSSHGSGCGCCAPLKLASSSPAAQAAPRVAGGRPWMISH